MLLKYNVNFKFPSVPMKYTLFLFIIVVVSKSANLCKLCVKFVNFSFLVRLVKGGGAGVFLFCFFFS